MERFLAHRIAVSWDARWGGCGPAGYKLRAAFPERWVRFHSLPDSKRYPDAPAEYAEILRRQNLLLGELGADRVLVVLTTAFAPPGESPVESGLTLLGLEGVPWRAYEEDGVVQHCYAAEVGWHPGVVDPLLRAVADDRERGVLIGPPDLRWLLAPYDGGADVFPATPEERERLSEWHAGWRSRHRSGL